MAAVNGNRMSDDYFHTELEDEPWWLVDCGADIGSPTSRLSARAFMILRLPTRLSQANQPL
jgi:hypothetical protein